MKPKVVIMADVDNWAWGRKAGHLKRWLSDEFDITVWYLKYGPVPAIFDLYHTFDLPNVAWVPESKKCVTGITAHVWPTWGADKVRIWAGRAEAIHANSRLLMGEMRRFERHTRQGKSFYVPNGVCPDQFQRTRPRPEGSTLIVGHQGKPNPRKGADVLQAAVEEARARGAQIDYRLNQRTSKDAITADAMREWYQDLHLLAVCSDMDGTPNPALEAAACEVAVLTNSIGNMPEFMRMEHTSLVNNTNWNGHLIEGLEPYGFALGMMPDACVNHPDRDGLIDAYAGAMHWAWESLIERCGSGVSPVVQQGVNARNTVRAAWTWKKQAERYRKMWMEVLGEHR
jgi:glycosyltransferase involved in cell wall biosynthesis